MGGDTSSHRSEKLRSRLSTVELPRTAIAAALQTFSTSRGATPIGTTSQGRRVAKNAPNNNKANDTNQIISKTTVTEEKKGNAARQKGAAERIPRLSLTCVAVCITTVTIAVVVSVMLATSITYSLEAADDFASMHARSNVLAAAGKVSDYAKIPLNAYVHLLQAGRQGLLAWFPTTPGNTTPIADEEVYDDMLNTARKKVYDEWLAVMRPLMFSSEFQLQYIAIGAPDGSWMSAAIDNKTARSHTMSFLNPHNRTFRKEENARPTTTTPPAGSPPVYELNPRFYYHYANGEDRVGAGNGTA